MDIMDEVRTVIANTLKVPIDQLKPDSRLDDLGAESLDVIEIVFELEEKFGITIPFKADDAARIKTATGQVDPGEVQFATIGEVASAVKALVDAKAAS
jgi:acyl carrier protein